MILLTNLKKFSDIENQELINYVSRCEKEPEYLIPIKNNEKWFTMIIYPSLNVKVASEKDGEIRNLIKVIKPDAKQNYIKELATCEKFSKPIEIDLDTCRNF